MCGVTAAVVVGGLASAYIASSAAKDAANTQAGAAANAAATQQNIANQQNANLQPWVQAGTGALQELKTGVGTATQPGTLTQPFSMANMQNVLPAYQFALQEGTGAINNAADAAGMHLSSANIENLGKYATGLASQTESNAFNQFIAGQNQRLNSLQSLAQVGQTASGQVNANLGNLGSNLSSLQVGAGNAQAAGQIGSANAISGGIGNVTNQLSQMNTLNSLFNTQAGTNFAPNTWGMGSAAPAPTAADTLAFTG